MGLPLKHNQLIVAKFFSHIRDDDHFWCKDFISEGKEGLRWDMLTSSVRERTSNKIEHTIIAAIVSFCSVMLTLACTTC